MGKEPELSIRNHFIHRMAAASDNYQISPNDMIIFIEQLLTIRYNQL
jgi:hypothetical protein